VREKGSRAGGGLELQSNRTRDREGASTKQHPPTPERRVLEFRRAL